MLRYIYHQRKRKELFIKIIHDYTDIYRKLDLYDQRKNKFRRGKIKVWKELVKQIQKNLKFNEKIFIKKTFNIL